MVYEINDKLFNVSLIEVVRKGVDFLEIKMVSGKIHYIHIQDDNLRKNEYLKLFRMLQEY